MERKKSMSKMSFQEQLDELLSLSKQTNEDIEKVKSMKEDSKVVMNQIINSYENMKQLHPILQSIKTLITQLIQVC